MKYVTTALVGLTVAMLGGAARAEESKYAKIKDGKGNCIFSKEVLEYGKEDSYKVTTKFKQGDEVHVRCYYPRLGDLAKDGKRQNSLRAAFGKGSIGVDPHFNATISWKNDTSWWFSGMVPYNAAEMEDRTGSRFDIPLGAASKDDCDWHMGKFQQPDKCVDLATETQNLRKYQSKSGSFTATICVTLSYEKVDRLRMVDFTEVDDPEDVGFAEGCFQYTID